MAYTFGAATTNNIVTPNIANLWFGNQYINLFMAWVYPTTLTSGRYLIGGAAGAGIYVNTTTSELRIRTINATTNGEWVTSGLGLVIDKWQFIAVLGTWNNTGPTGTARAYIGDENRYPTEVTVNSAVAPVGNYTLSSGLTIGNQTSATSLSWQGDIGWVTASASNPVFAVGNRLWVSTVGVITAAEQKMIYDAYILPGYVGRFHGEFDNEAYVGPDSAQPYHCLMNLDSNLPILRKITGSNLTITTPQNLTINGATPSLRRSPNTPFASTSIQLGQTFRR